MAVVLRMGMLCIASLAGQAVAAPPQGPVAPLSLDALRLLQPGLWQLEIKGSAPRQICVADPVALVQIEHDQPGCSRFVIANEAQRATVHYSCQRAGWGRTTIRVETPVSAAIQTQGIARNQPFDHVVQARHVGPCTGQTASR